MAKKKFKYNRVLLKLSGEVFKGDLARGIDGKVVTALAKDIMKLQKQGVQIGVVIGGGNIWRFRDFNHLDLGRVASDTMGMMATIMNALAFENVLKAAQKKINMASGDLDKLVGARTRVMQRKLKNVEELPLAEADSVLGLESGEEYVEENENDE